MTNSEISQPVQALSAVDLTKNDFSYPAGYKTIISSKKGNVFTGNTPSGCNAALYFSNTDQKVVSYEIRSMQDGQIKDSGVVASSSATTYIYPRVSSFGAYFVYIRGSQVQVPYDTVLGCTEFGLIPSTPSDVNLPELGLKTDFGSSAPFYDADAGMWGWVQAGPERYSIYDAGRLNSELGNLISNIKAQKKYYVTGKDGNVADPVRNRPVFVNFVNFQLVDPYKSAVLSNGNPDTAKRAQALSDADYSTAVLAGVKTAVEALVAEGVYFFEGRNEPIPGNDPNSISLLKSFYGAVHSAVLPSGSPPVKVIGPAFVSATSGLDDFLKGCNGSYPFDEFSFHPYNAVNGDFDMAERQMILQNSILAKYNLQNMQKWQTEQSYSRGMWGTIEPLRAVYNQCAQTLVFERHNQPIEKSYAWHHQANGDWAFPSWVGNPDRSISIMGYFFRQYVTETWAKPYASAYDFGSANSIWYGNRYDGQGPATGKSVSIFAGKNTKYETLKLTVSGNNIPSSLITADPYGNTLELNVINNQITLPPNLDPLRYVRHSSSITLTPSNLMWGGNLALVSNVITDTNSNTVLSKIPKRITNGTWENSYDFTTRSWGSDKTWIQSTSQEGDIDSIVPLPYNVIIDLLSPKDISRVVLGSPPRWQKMSSILSAEIYTASANDVSFTNASDGTTLTGTPISDSGTNKTGNHNPNNAFDGNLLTEYQSLNATGYIGLQLTTATTINKIRFQLEHYFEGGAIGNVFEGSTTGQSNDWHTIATITSQPSGGTITEIASTSATPYTYVRYNDIKGNNVRIIKLEFIVNVVLPAVSVAGNWSLKAKFGQTNQALKIFNDQNTTATHLMDLTSLIARWNIEFPKTNARFIKLVVYSVTNGEMGSFEASKYFSFHNTVNWKMLTLSEVEIYEN